MALSEAAPRSKRHNRTLEMAGYQREDGLWDIEGHLRDIKDYSFDSTWRGKIEAGTPVHDMWIRLTVDDTLTIRAVEASLDAGPHPICADITPNFKVLEGQRIAPGWFLNVKKLLGGAKGCVHMVEMLGPMGTVAYQTLGPNRVTESQDSADGRTQPKPARLDTCHVFASDGELVKQRWPDFYTGK
ncbi:MAG: DUF2889 domain-containing protein [Alphaproteobacteria bacterium]|nr:MAG: DUF2889 domain-containing protein [Alphaproteobacteria bacterium]